ncbi:hypothetical protein Q5P01_003978 [Channa striata]|uniref:TNFR-Cys domain-containing protein n=1 Tax=Channa striata TaxID=64152 RepID=A0AA88NLX7_CHASR|nr:hypothetical protein Q5P01_003978 [Channa striata]
MRLSFSTSWIFRGWITCFLVTFYAQHVVSKSLQCDEKHYLRGQRCCKKCEPGFYVHAHCNESQQTKCIKCNFGEYQPGWTEETECLRQKFCDEGKGFMKSVENPVAEEPCRCRSDLQCHPINCEYCEKIPTCNAGFGLEADPESTNGRKICAPCKTGFFSAGTNGECKQWTNCKAEGRSETQPGSAQADAVCGPPVSAPSWVIVSILSVITVLCLLILLLFCYKDKLTLLSVNLRSCVQNLKRTRIQQETLAPLYQSGGPKCAPCETTKLIYQPSRNSTDEPSTFPTSDSDFKVSLPLTREKTEKDETSIQTLTEDQSKGSGEPEEVSEEEEVVSASPLLLGSCVCVVPVCEPLEVGENEDCSQAVSPGTSGTCSCGGLDGDKDGDERDSVRAEGGGEKIDGNQEKVVLSKSETGAASLVSLSPPPLHMSSIPHPLSSGAQEFKTHLSERSQLKEQDLHKLTSTDCTSTECSTTCLMTSVSPLMTSSSVGELYLDRSPEASGQEKGQGLLWEESSGRKLSSGESELECSPESLHSQLTEPNLISGQVLGKQNTTFISSGQVMNFSGDVVVVYVSQTSLGSDGTGQDDSFGSPVQEEASETAQSFQNSPRSRGDSICQATLQDETLPVQEKMVEQPMGK